MCDESLCSVLGVEAALLATKVKNMCQAACDGRIADVEFVLQHAPEKVNDQDYVLLLLHSHAADYCCGTGSVDRSALRCLEEPCRSC